MVIVSIRGTKLAYEWLIGMNKNPKILSLILTLMNRFRYLDRIIYLSNCIHVISMVKIIS